MCQCGLGARTGWIKFAIHVLSIQLHSSPLQLKILVEGVEEGREGVEGEEVGRVGVEGVEEGRAEEGRAEERGVAMRRDWTSQIQRYVQEVDPLEL